MTATISRRIGASRLLTAFVAARTATGSFEDTLRHPDATGAGTRRDPGRRLETALARTERAVADLVRWWRDGLERRRMVRELRLMGRSRLADLGIEADAIAHVVDALLAADREVGAPEDGGTPSRSA